MTGKDVRRRCWWGWGYEDEHLDPEGLAGLAGALREQFGFEGLTPRSAAAIDAVDVPDPRIRVPDALSHLAAADPDDRVRYGHGQAFRDVVVAFEGRLERLPDIVLRPTSDDEVEAVLDWAADAGVAVVPFGGGTSVVGGVNAPPGTRPVATLDLGALAGIREVDTVSRAARIGAGTFGPQIEDGLRPHGLTLRHFPQSWEFSTLGGWIATRAGGHFATRTTHIDDLVEAVSAVMPAGRWESRRLPGSGAGPSPDRLLLGSEGTLGVITEAWVRVQVRPTHRAQATVEFPTFAAGATAVRALAQSGLDPANCRLLDPVESVLSFAGDGSAALLVLGFESADHPLQPWMARALEIVREHDGRCPDGPRYREGDRTGTAEGGAGAWRQAFLRGPYLRDALVALGAVVETFETAITWDRFDDFVETVRAAASKAAAEVAGRAVVSTRLTHVYPDGAAPYFTVVAQGRDGARVGQWDEIKAAASEAILAAGGTITHHHAVGRDHAPWYRRQRPDLFARAIEAARATLDPTGVLNPGVLDWAGADLSASGRAHG